MGHVNDYLRAPSALSASSAANSSTLSGGWNLEFLPHIHVIGIFQFVFVGIEDPHVVFRVSIKLLADLRQSIARLNGVELELRRLFSRRSGRRGSRGGGRRRPLRSQGGINR